LEEESHCVVHGFYRHLNSDRNAPHHCLVDSADSSDADYEDAAAAAAAAVGFVMDGGEASGMDAEIVVVDGDLYGMADVVGLFEMDVDVDLCDVGGLLTADAGNDEDLDLKTVLNQGQLVVIPMQGCEDH
jgi:hypothetical protein